jgi:hypothetical protein
VGKTVGKQSLGGTGRRWENNIKMDLRETGCEDDWSVELAQYHVQWQALLFVVLNLLALLPES